ncbi:MAG: hypothetical protein P8Y23_14920 [Candidatus Lokiarchaeota archaeon]
MDKWISTTFALILNAETKFCRFYWACKPFTAIEKFATKFFSYQLKLFQATLIRIMVGLVWIYETSLFLEPST